MTFDFAGWNTKADGSGESYSADDTLTIDEASVTLYAQWSAIGVAGPAGGWVFYDKGSYSEGWRFVEAAPASTELTNQWSAQCYEIGGTLTDVGTGQRNTTRIVGAVSQPDCPAEAAALLTHPHPPRRR